MREITRKTLIPLLVFILFSFWLSCGPSQPTGGYGERLLFSNQEFSKSSGDCAHDTSGCVSIQFSYPMAEGGSIRARSLANAAIQSLLADMLGVHDALENPSPSLNLDRLAAEFIEDYYKYTSDEPFVQKWTLELEGKVAHNGQDLISICMNGFTYTGGAHPNYFTTYLNFEPTTGKLLSLPEFISDTVALKKIGESWFRKTQHIPTELSLDEAGYWFQDNQFSLPGNIGFHTEGLVMYFNPYEIAPYASGATEVIIPLSELSGMMSRKVFDEPVFD